MRNTEGTTPAPEGATPELTRLDQAAWEAPALRPVFTAALDTEEWAYDCPPWCRHGDDGHTLVSGMRGRRHDSSALRVKVDGGYSYWAVDLDDEGDEEGVIAAHLAVKLVAGSRSPQDSRIKISYVAGSSDDGERVSMGLGAPMYHDEVRELIAVLQHLLKVGQEG